jgi:predicted DCC family thiol-disulfide oxidoreductase YuxK
MPTTAMTLFYDGYCPLCLIEIKKLMSLDKQQQISFVDIHSNQFIQQYSELDQKNLDARIHAYLANGQLINGLDVTYLAWKLVGKGWVYAPLRWPVISWFADHVYTFFAIHRHRISYLLTGKKRCVPCETNQGGADV